MTVIAFAGGIRRSYSIVEVLERIHARACADVERHNASLFEAPVPPLRAQVLQEFPAKAARLAR